MRAHIFVSGRLREFDVGTNLFVGDNFITDRTHYVITSRTWSVTNGHVTNKKNITINYSADIVEEYS